MKKNSIITSIFIALTFGCFSAFAQVKTSADKTTASTVDKAAELVEATEKFEELYRLISRLYVDPVDENIMIQDAIDGMSNRLRPYSVYLPTEKLKSFSVPTESDVQGIGISFKMKYDTLIVEDVIENGSAATAGIVKGDRIVQIDDKVFADQRIKNTEIRELLLGTVGSSIALHIVKEGDSIVHEKALVRNEIEGYNVLTLKYSNQSKLPNFNKALACFDELYADSVPANDIAENAIRGMLDKLDPHSIYIPKQEVAEMNAPLKGNFEGIGIRFQILRDTIMVVNPIPGGPSEKVGIRAGDKIINVESKTIAGVGITNSGVRDNLLGKKDSKVTIEILRRGEQELLSFSITRDKIPIYSLDSYYMAAPEIGYVKLNNFGATTMDEFYEAVGKLKIQGMKHMILDLQGNGGGYLRTAIQLADEFLNEDKMIVYTNGRYYDKKEYHARKTGYFEEGKLVVLVDQSSASASEIVSGAIQDWDRGLIVGRRSFGKGLVQKPIPLSDKSQVRLTTSRYYTPTGRCIQKPYGESKEDYQREKYERLQTGELTNKDSINFPDSLRFKTRIANREVFGGGGIMPDVFVAVDTSYNSKFYTKLWRNGIFNTYGLTYVDDNRNALKKKYPTFEIYKKEFEVDDKFLKKFLAYAKDEGVEKNSKEFNKSKKAIQVKLKAIIAQNIWDSKKYYEINNELNPTYIKGIEVLQDDTFHKMKLAVNGN
jgi:carboxyl-terminal processing protease